jgi:hypothetical protein
MIFYRTTRLMLSSAAILSFASSAFALDGGDLLKKINAAYAMQGGSLAADGVDVDGSTVTLKGASFKPVTAAGPGAQLGNLKLTGVEEDADGGYHIDKVNFADIAVTQDGTTISATDMTLGDVSIPADATKGGIDSLIIPHKGHTGAVTISKAGKEVLALQESNFNNIVRPDKSGYDMDGAVTGIKADLSDVQDPKAQETIDKLALQHVAGSFTTKGSWELAPGTVNIKELALDLNDVGKLNISLGISGYTLEFMKSMQDAIKASQADPNKPEAQQASGLAMLGLMQQLTLDNAEITFKDASITKRVLEYAGASQGVSGPQMANTLKALTPLMLAQLKLPDLQAAVSAAVSSYLDDPKNFTVTAAPAKPVPFPMIVGAAMGAPNTIPSVIGLKVSANN